MAADDSAIYVADSDNDELVVVAPAKGIVKARVKVGRWPERVAVAPDGRVFVTNRHDRSVSVVDPIQAKEVARIRVGAEPVGLAFTGDGRLLVANHTQGTVSIVDLATLKETKQVRAAADPLGVAVVPGDKAYVTHARSGLVTVLDLTREAFTAAPVSLTLAPGKTADEVRLPNTPVDPAYNAEDGRVYVPHQQSKLTPVATTLDTPDAYTGGGTTSVAVVANALATIDVASDTVLDAPGRLSGCFGCRTTSDVPAAMAPAEGPLSGASAIAIEPSGQWMYVTNLHSDNVSIVATRPRQGSFAPVKVGAGPNGVAVSAAGDRAWVYNSFSHSISVLEAADGVIKATREFPVGLTSLTPQQDKGRRLFHSAADPRMTNARAGGIACASCHPSGRDDGRTWQFSEGPRNTPLLAGRGLRDTAPYHWDGALDDMHAFKLVVETRMGGTGTQKVAADPLSADDFDAMLAYLDALPAPDNPWRGEVLTEAQVRGRVLFSDETVGCARCHAGTSLQDNVWHDVGTKGAAELFPHDGEVNTPTLRGLFASAPYLHDGRDATLFDRVRDNPGDAHGTTSHLSDAQLGDLVEFLKTL